MAKYILEGLDCAHCAQEIESALRRVDRFRDARVNFATQSVHLEERHAPEAQDIIDRVEEGVRLRPAAESGAGAGDARRERLGLLRLAAAAVLFGAGLALQGADGTFRWLDWRHLPFALAYALVGFPVLLGAAKGLLRGKPFNELFLMGVATLGAIAIRQLPEAVGVMLFYAVGEHLQERAVARSRRSIAGLLALRPERARLVEEGVGRPVPPEAVAAGDLVEVLPGERVPLDGRVEEGESFVDRSALSGESLPKAVAPGDEVLSGYVNGDGRLLLRVSRPFGQSAAARVLELVEEAGARKAPTERLITAFAAVYTPIVVGLAALVALLPPLFLPGAGFAEWLYRALVILVISCPCALVLSVPLGYFAGIGGASRRKLLVKGANYLDALARVDTVAFDKTGTLTKGNFAVVETVPRGRFGADELRRLAAAAESRSAHPIARAIAGGRAPDEPVGDVREFRGLGVSATVGGRRVVAGNDRLLHREAVPHPAGDCGAAGTVVHVAVDGEYAGYLRLADEVKPEAAAAVAELRRLGVRRVALLTGDDRGVAAAVAAELGVDECFAEQTPEDKVRNLEALMAGAPRGRTVAFVGDGMNDAPVLVRADVGLAMGALGSEAAVEAADVVVMDDKVERVPQALRLAAATRRVVRQNIVFALAVKLAVVAFGIAGLADMWEAVVADVGVSLLAVLNSLRAAGRTGGPRGA